MKYLIIILLLVSSCSTERKCRNWQIKGQKLGCLKPDSIKVTDTIILTDFDTLVKFDSVHTEDTLIVANGGIKTLVFTKWKTREVRVLQKSDTIYKTRTIPVQKIVKGDCDKINKYFHYVVSIFLLGIFLGVIIKLNKNR